MQCLILRTRNAIHLKGIKIIISVHAPYYYHYRQPIRLELETNVAMFINKPHEILPGQRVKAKNL